MPTHISFYAYLNEFVDGYIACALWCGVVEDESCETYDEDSRESYEVSDLTRDAIRRMRRDCRSFIGLAAPQLQRISASEAGHCFWLSRNRHGAGFFEHGLDKLQTDAKTFGEAYLYLNRARLCYAGGC